METPAARRRGGDGGGGFLQGFAKHCGVREDGCGRGRAAPRHERVWLPSLCLSLYKGGERGGGALGFPPRGGGQGEMGGAAAQGLGFPPQAPCPPSQGVRLP